MSAENDLGRFEVIPLTGEVAAVSSMVHAELARAGKQIGINEVYIGATAVKYGLTLVTRKTAHFERISKLRMERY